MTRRPHVPGSRDPRHIRTALRGLDGGAQLRAALDEARAGTSGEYDVVVVDNGSRGPAVIDTRGRPPGGWVLDGLIPTGGIVALADLDDPSPKTLLDNGFDAVVQLQARGEALIGARVRVAVYRADRLGVEPVTPFWVVFDPARGGFVAVDADNDAGSDPAGRSTT